MKQVTSQKSKKRRRKVSSCKRKIQGEKCPGKYCLDYENNIPIFTCDTCGDVDRTWETFYSDYLSLYQDKENWKIKKHQASCILGCFCYAYKKKYGVDFTFIPQNPNPFSSKEIKDIRILLNAFDGDAISVRKYIKWIFTKAITSSTKITSFGYLITPNLIRKYKLKVRDKPNRASKLPKSFLSWLKESTPEILERYELGTYNDLSALLSHYNKFSDSVNLAVEKDVLNQAESMGLITNGKVNI